MSNEIGKRIKYYRLSKELSRDVLAKKLGISIHTLAKYEQGQRQPNIEILKKIGSILDVDASVLLGLELLPIEANNDRFKEMYLKKRRFEFVKEMHNENPNDSIMVNIVNNFDAEGVPSVMEYEKESYRIFKELLTSLQYTSDDIGSSGIYLFKQIKHQIELEIKMLKEQR
ncbi:helix-turn-helix transcriptional regulator [Clostridium botulinum]|nr:helix-turn-helix transcriptional regulator [Clostridium botulinum]